jgi:hypothetical protein
LCAVALLMVCAACQSVSYTTPQGERFVRRTLGASSALAVLTVETSTDGTRRLELRGYRVDTTQTVSALTEAAVRGALAGLKPPAAPPGSTP